MGLAPANEGDNGNNSMKRKSGKKTCKPHGDLNAQYFAVCLLDVLGQTKRLQDWSQLPADGTITPAFEEALKKTVGTLANLRNHFKNLFEQLTVRTIPDDQWKYFTPDQRSVYYRTKDCDLKVLNFSDTFVFFAPMSNDHGDVMVVPIYRMLAACALTMLLGLATKVPLRGAITIGTGVDLGSDGFYGPALAEAHGLESKCASYPRIIVSDKVLQFLNLPQFTADSSIDAILGRKAGLAKKLICSDTDCFQIVDFLGEGVRTTLLEAAGAKAQGDSAIVKRVKMAYEFVLGEALTFEQAKDLKHLDRYERLRAYMESRLPAWSIPVGK